MREADLYAPIKQLLEGQGYEVKGEIGAADIAARRGEDELLIVELKTGFSLTLYHQAVERQSLTDLVYIAVFHKTGRAFYKSLLAQKKLCRRLGLGLITVRPKYNFTTVHLDPAPYKPRLSKPKKARLLKEFSRRVGDPNTGGQTRSNLMTAYRQDALKCALVLRGSEPMKASHVKAAADVPRARNIMADNHYGWFEKTARGVYGLSAEGLAALPDYAKDIAMIEAAQNTPPHDN